MGCDQLLCLDQRLALLASRRSCPSPRTRGSRCPSLPPSCGYQRRSSSCVLCLWQAIAGPFDGSPFTRTTTSKPHPDAPRYNTKRFHTLRLSTSSLRKASGPGNSEPLPRAFFSRAKRFLNRLKNRSFLGLKEEAERLPRRLVVELVQFVPREHNAKIFALSQLVAFRPLPFNEWAEPHTAALRPA